MSRRADHLSLLLDLPSMHRVSEGFGRTLARHLTGQRVRSGDLVALPGWPQARVDLAEPEDSVVGPGTRIELHLPPPKTKGALSLAMVVDASLTMGRGGSETRFERCARTIDAVLLNGRAFLQRAGIVVQGGTTRHVEPLQDPEALAGASILKVAPKGTFDLEAGLAKAVDLVAEAPEGPRAVLVLTDGADVPKDPLKTVRAALHAGVVVTAITVKPSERLDGICEATGGMATQQPAKAFQHLAELAGTRAAWSEPEPPTQPETEREEPYEFEVVIEAME